jgi:hypothetical protein
VLSEARDGAGSDRRFFLFQKFVARDFGGWEKASM